MKATAQGTARPVAILVKWRAAASRPELAPACQFLREELGAIRISRLLVSQGKFAERACGM